MEGIRPRITSNELADTLHPVQLVGTEYVPDVDSHDPRSTNSIRQHGNVLSFLDEKGNRYFPLRNKKDWPFSAENGSATRFVSLLLRGVIHGVSEVVQGEYQGVRGLYSKQMTVEKLPENLHPRELFIDKLLLTALFQETDHYLSSRALGREGRNMIVVEKPGAMRKMLGSLVRKQVDKVAYFDTDPDWWHTIHLRRNDENFFGTIVYWTSLGAYKQYGGSRNILQDSLCQEKVLELRHRLESGFYDAIVKRVNPSLTKEQEAGKAEVKQVLFERLAMLEKLRDKSIQELYTYVQKMIASEPPLSEWDTMRGKEPGSVKLRRYFYRE